jgi:hypothetical protein
MKRQDRSWIKLVASAIADERGSGWKEERKRISGIYRMTADTEAPDERDVEFRLPRGAGAGYLAKTLAAVVLWDTAGDSAILYLKATGTSGAS